MIEEYRWHEKMQLFVSNLGNLKDNKGNIVKPHYINGYAVKRKTRIHRAVAELFIPNPENKPHIDHINTIKDDNRVENLRWVTPKENCNNPLTRLHISEANKNREFSEEHRKNLSESLKNSTPWNKGKSGVQTAWNKGLTGIYTEETLQKMRKPKTEEHRRKLSEAAQGKYVGEKNPMYGKNSEDYMTPEAIILKRQHMAESRKGRKFYNNGIKQIFVKKEDVPDGYILGKLKK